MDVALRSGHGCSCKIPARGLHCYWVILFQSRSRIRQRSPISSAPPSLDLSAAKNQHVGVENCPSRLIGQSSQTRRGLAAASSFSSSPPSQSLCFPAGLRCRTGLTCSGSVRSVTVTCSGRRVLLNGESLQLLLLSLSSFSSVHSLHSSARTAPICQALTPSSLAATQ